RFRLQGFRSHRGARPDSRAGGRGLRRDAGCGDGGSHRRRGDGTMKITDVTATVLASRYDRPIRFAHMELTERRIILVRVYTDEGVVGLADVDGPPAGDMACVPLVHDTFRPLLVGKDPLDIGARNADM